MIRSRMAIGAVALALIGLSSVPAQGQHRPLDQLKPLQPSGDIVAPFFDGWFTNPDGTYTLSFGFFNRNTEQVIDIPIGENNFIEPAQFNGMQPTHFPPVSYGGFGGRRERGAFAIRIPSEMAGQDVVWTLTHNGQTHSVPGRVTAVAYEMGYVPMAAGSVPPLVRFEANGPTAQGREGLFLPTTLNASVGQPVPITVWGEDISVRDEGAEAPLNVTWQKHQGPGEMTFEPATQRFPEGGTAQSNATATFSAPGEYMLRARVDNFGASDSRFGNQCCWSNAYVRVNVTP